MNSLNQKILALLSKLPDADLSALNPSAPTMSTAITTALAEEFGIERADEIAFHLTDWSADAAFLVALALYPDQFTADEVEEGVRGFLIHAPNHIAAAATLAGHPLQAIFKIGILSGGSTQTD